MHFFCEIHFATPLILKHTDINNAFANRQHVIIQCYFYYYFSWIWYFLSYYVIAIFMQTDYIVTCTESQPTFYETIDLSDIVWTLCTS